MNQEDIDRIEKLFRLNRWHLTADLWRVGVNLALRISDLLSLTFEEVSSDVLFIREGKTSKMKRVVINGIAREIIDRRRREFPDHIYLFQATGNRVKSMPPKPVSRQLMGKHFKMVGEEMELRLGTHSMRKTRGRAMYNAGVTLEKIAKVLNHAHPSITMRYIGIEQSEIDQTYLDFEL